MGFVRMSFIGAAAYFFFLLAFPEWEGGAGRHFLTIVLIVGVALAVDLALKAIRTATILGSVLLDIAFGLGVILYFAWNMPQQSGKPPMQLLMEGHRPDRRAARQGLARLGLNTESAPAQFVLGLFPKK